MFFSEFGLSKIGIVACLKGKRHSDKLWGLLWLAQSSCVLLHMALQLQVKALSTRHEAQIRMLSQCTSHMSMSFSAFGSTWNSSQSQIATVKQCTSHSKAGQFAQSQRVYANWEWPLWCLQIHAKHPKQRGHWCGHNMHACAVSAVGRIALLSATFPYFMTWPASHHTHTHTVYNAFCAWLGVCRII